MERILTYLTIHTLGLVIKKGMITLQKLLANKIVYSLRDHFLLINTREPRKHPIITKIDHLLHLEINNKQISSNGDSSIIKTISKHFLHLTVTYLKGMPLREGGEARGNGLLFRSKEMIP